MPRRSKRQAPAAGGKKLELSKKEDTLQPKKTMADLPPEVVTIILDHLMRIETRKNILGCRLVNSQWFDIIRPFLERKIISGGSPVFPRLKICSLNKRQDLLHVFQSPTMCPTGHNPFPFNALSLVGDTDQNYFPKSNADVQRMELPKFMSSFGGYLTTLEVQDLIFPGVHSVLTLLSSLTSLKTLRVQHVRLLDRIIKPKVYLPRLPPLPTLTTLVVKSHSNFAKPNKYEPEGDEEKSNIFYLWLIASYAEHLLNLDLETLKPPLALQRKLAYVYDCPDGQFLFIEKPSESAFQNLKKLKIHNPSHDFLRLSELPKLEQLTVTSRIEIFENLLDMISFINKCRDTIKTVRLEVDWKTPMDYVAKVRVALEGVVLNTKLKTLEINYSTTHDQSDEAMMMMFISLFTNLEKLHFFRFPSYCIATAKELETINRVVRTEQLAEEIVDVKTQLASLEQVFYQRLTAIRFEVQTLVERKEEFVIRLDALNPQEFEADLEAFRFEELNLQKREDELDQKLRNIQNTAKKNRAKIVKQFAALGIRKQDVIVEQFLERHGVWNSFANLKLLSVSSVGKSDGDVCLVQRPDEA